MRKEALHTRGSFIGPETETPLLALEQSQKSTEMPAGTLNETGPPNFICTPFGFTYLLLSTSCSKRLRLHVPLLLGIHHACTFCSVNPVAFGEGVGVEGG